MTEKLKVGILGATGTVGQRFIQLLENHPQFEVTEVCASERSEGKNYAQAAAWKLATPLPERVGRLKVKPIEPTLDCDIVFSSLPSSIAASAEVAFAQAGYPVISNSSALRMEADVPLVIPEINADHLGLITRQRTVRNFDKGFVVTNPNCSVITFAAPLAALSEAFGVESVAVTTLQAVSGAGYPGVPSLDVADNVVPYIDGEEPKVETEPQKILGQLIGDSIEHASFSISAQCNRVPVLDGHLACLKVKLSVTPAIEDVRYALEDFDGPALTSSPPKLIVFRDEIDRPQPRLDRDASNGMAITVGRLQPDNVFDFRFVALSHNTIRGAAGAAILNAELLADRGWVGG
jgi:aspartate-semialdehyde dehydrogenase